MATGGSIESTSFAGRTFAVPADNAAQLRMGGFNNEIQMNGNGTGREIKTRVACGVDGLLVEIDHLTNDLQFLQDLANRIGGFDWEATLADSSVFQGRMTIVGELQGSTQDATASVSLQGAGVITRQ